jgi:hypothetical protein
MRALGDVDGGSAIRGTRAFARLQSFLWIVPAVATLGCSSASGSGGPAATDAGYDGPFEVPIGAGIQAALTGCAGPGYAAKFLVGTQTFELTIDTGSGTLAVASSACSGCGVTPAYAPGPSATDLKQRASDTYVQGSWQGEVYTDSAELAGASTPAQMNIAAIDSQNMFFSSAGCGLGTVPFAPQGIVGFGPSALAVQGTDGFVTKFLQASGLPAVFALEFCEQGGQLMFGGVDPRAAALTGPAVYTPLTGSQYYTVALDDLTFGSKSLGFGTADFGAVTVDTGTSVLALPSAVFKSLEAAIQATPAFAAAFGSTTGLLGSTQCFTSNLSLADMDAQFPLLTLSFPAMGGGRSVVTMKATKSYLPPTTSKGMTYYCSGIYENPLGTGTILGSSAMLGQMVIFDLEANRIGFAPQSFCH